MKDIAGVSAFGLNSSVFQSGKYFCEDDYYLTDAVLPMNPFGRIRTGKEAEDERIHTGLYWPPETRISGEDWLRRVPVSYAWRAFVEAGDSMVRWNAGHGVYFPLIPHHCRTYSQLAQQSQQHWISQGKNPDCCDYSK